MWWQFSLVILLAFCVLPSLMVWFVKAVAGWTERSARHDQRLSTPHPNVPAS